MSTETRYTHLSFPTPPAFFNCEMQEKHIHPLQSVLVLIVIVLERNNYSFRVFPIICPLLSGNGTNGSKHLLGDFDNKG